MKNTLFRKKCAIVLASVMLVTTIQSGQVMAGEVSETEPLSDQPEAEIETNTGISEEAVSADISEEAVSADISETDSSEEKNAELPISENNISDTEITDVENTEVEIPETEITEEEETVLDGGTILDGGTMANGITWSIDSNNVLTFSGSGAIPAKFDSPWMEYNTTVTEIVISPGITGIGYRDFSGFSAVTSVTIPDSVEYIDYYAFENCKALKSVSIPDKVTHIYGCAFCGCESLETVSFGACLSLIDQQAFRDCSSLVSITFTGDAPEIYSGAFSGVPYAGSAYVFYPSGNSTWTEDVMQDYGGNLIWKSDTDYVCYYLDGEGYRYNSLEDLPCETDYIRVNKFTDGTITKKYGHKSHLCNESYVDQDGNTVDPYTLACGTTYYVVSTCTQCDYVDSTEAIAEHVMVAWTYRGTDGTNYINTAAMPCGTEYTEIGICGKCSARVEGTTVYTKEHFYAETYTVDETEYQSYNAVPCGSQYTLTEVCEYCGAENEETGIAQHSYDEGYYTVDGVRYPDYDSIPCDTDYILKSICSKCGDVEEYHLHRYHFGGVSGYKSADGTVVYDGFDQIPCESSYITVCVCQNCGETYEQSPSYLDHAVAQYTLVGENGEAYATSEDVPCGLNYTATGTCTHCGETIIKSYRRPHYFTSVFTTSDGEEYYCSEGIPDSLPCGSSYQCTTTCWCCGITVVTYGKKEHDGTSHYTDTNGNEYDYWEDIPCLTKVTRSFSCDYCGESVSEECYKGHNQESEVITDENGIVYEYESEIPCGTKYTCTYTCPTCGKTITENCRSDHSADNFDYITEDYEAASYYLEDGTEISGYQDTWASCQIINKVCLCTRCGQYYSELLDTHDWEDTDGGAVCSICGLTRNEVYPKENLIFRQSDSVLAKNGEIVILSVYCEKYVDYLWQYSLDCGVTWEDCADTTNSGNYSFTMNPSYDGFTYHCLVTLAGETETSDPILVTLNESIKITSQPADQIVVVGNSFSFKVAATGSGLTYLWEYSKDGGTTWTATTRTKNNYGTKATNAMNGRMFRCIITDEDGDYVISYPVTLTVKPAIEITSQTDAQTVALGDLFRFKVTAKSNTGSKLTYLWQYSKTLKGWTDTTRTLNNYGTYATLGVDGRYYRCKITDEAGNVVYSTPAMLRVLSDITITEQPADTTVATGKRFYFTVTATGSSITYKWEYSKDGGKTWISTTRTKNNYTTYAKNAMNGWMYRCIITDSSNNSVTTEAGTLTVQ